MSDGIHGETLTRFIQTREFQAPDRGGIRLFAIAGPQQGASYPLETGDTDVGRLPQNGIVLYEDSVSKLHCAFHRDAAGKVFVKDSGSRNGTEVNGRMLAGGQRLELAHGDTVRICSTVLLYVHPDAEKEETRIDIDMARARQEAESAVSSIKGLVDKVRRTKRG